jgi:hypothetical protein
MPEQGPSRSPAFAEVARSFCQGEVEFGPCEKIDWHNLSKNDCPPLNMPDAQEGY